MKLFHVDLNKEDAYRTDPAFITILKFKKKNRYKWTLILRLPLVFKYPSYYDMYTDSFREDIWCTPVIIIRRLISFNDYEISFIGKCEII